MLEISLDDPHFAENALAVMRLKKMGVPIEDLERLYQKQLEADLKEAANDTN